jgi:hypothetical protein
VRDVEVQSEVWEVEDVEVDGLIVGGRSPYDNSDDNFRSINPIPYTLSLTLGVGRLFLSFPTQFRYHAAYSYTFDLCGRGPFPLGNL